MQDEEDLSFAIPTNRLRDVGETVKQYDEHFWRNGHSPQIIVFDDSTPTNQERSISRCWRQQKRITTYITSALVRKNSSLPI
jgi:hypothetical protein